ncbi:MAG TPA: hypothetical protein VFB72_21135 [Verrucomicrobiae bacterium]|nr:hypothetical protein [Verrucomicrobiae bacterium]
MIINRKFKRAFKRKFVSVVSVALAMSFITLLPTAKVSADTSPLPTSPIPDQTQNYKQIPVGAFSSGNTNTIAPSTTATLASIAPVIPVSDYNNVGITIQFTPLASWTGNTTIGVLRGPNLSMLETTPSSTITIPNNGANQVTYYTNLSVPSEGVIVLTNWVNGSTTTFSNITVIATTKAYRVQSTRP